MSCQVPPPWRLDFWVLGPPNLGLTLPWKPEVEGDLEVIWLVCLVLQTCHWRPGRGLACVSVPSQDGTVSPGASLPSSPSFSCPAGRALGQRKPPATSRGQDPVLCAGSQQKQVAALCHLAAHFKSDYWMPRSSHL